MSPQLPQLLKAAAIVVGAGIVLYKFKWSEFPAFLVWMLGEVARQVATLGDGVLPAWAIAIEDVLCVAAICEVILQSRLDVRIDLQVRVFVWAVASAKILASIPELTPIREWYLFRSYFLWAAFFVLFGITIARWRYPILERKVTKVLRLGMTSWVFVLAASGSFVVGGIGYNRWIPYTRHTWEVVNLSTHLGIGLVAIVMSAAMAASAPGRKRAAKKPDGRTVTGLIEIEKVA